MIRFSDVTAGYGEKRPLTGLSLSLPDSGTVAVFGPSGCGKTTFLRLLLHADDRKAGKGVPRVYAGRILGLEGKRFATVFQEDRLLLWRTARENVSLVNPSGDAGRILRSLGLAEDALCAYPAALSGGMQRRVSIARALNYPGDILLLDEPFKGLDIDTRALVADRIRGAFPLTILVTHDPAEASLLNASLRLQLTGSQAMV